ncbi:MAG: hypothetical protein A2Y62_04395 [Candidatus Fischerbacteria bacterium RBG_13_37_8]|uniref:Uncharacterized protein n=1 Tax=Candidatus Fischerbacteria bacterium RBG_13_37_8 TaxID=1817863 RepID=A0A1F5VU25_9BACT|nr:MAG: hypothetical protein A2Y62_04395 [Candidatus Fischerbacteria bacterium RBG_13_37_8]
MPDEAVTTFEPTLLNIVWLKNRKSFESSTTRIHFCPSFFMDLLYSNSFIFVNSLMRNYSLILKELKAYLLTYLINMHILNIREE